MKIRNTKALTLLEIIIVIIIVVLGMWAMDVGKNGVILIKHVDGNIIKDGVIN